MSRFPYMNLPFPFYKTPSRGPAELYNFSTAPTNNSKNVARDSQYFTNTLPASDGVSKAGSLIPSHIPEENRESRNFEPKNKSNNNTNDYLFDLFGLKIYYDDVLLVSLIYFLYSEGVKDDGLFIVLVLLLLC